MCIGWRGWNIEVVELDGNLLLLLLHDLYSHGVGAITENLTDSMLLFEFSVHGLLLG